MKRAATAAVLAMALGCDAINGIPDRNPPPPPDPPFRCDAGEMIVIPPAPELLKCTPAAGYADGGVDAY